MQTLPPEPMDASKPWCPNLMCSARGKMGEGTMTIQEKQRRRSRCAVCHPTVSQRRGTLFEKLRKPIAVVLIVVTQLSSGCLMQAFPLDERTVARLAGSGRSAVSTDPRGDHRTGNAQRDACPHG
jgi:hypothetical protein